EAMVGELGDEDPGHPFDRGIELQRTGQSAADTFQQPVLFLDTSAAQCLPGDQDDPVDLAVVPSDGCGWSTHVEPGRVTPVYGEGRFPGFTTLDAAGQLEGEFSVGLVDPDVEEGKTDVVVSVVRPVEFTGEGFPVAQQAVAV